MKRSSAALFTTLCLAIPNFSFADSNIEKLKTLLSTTASDVTTQQTSQTDVTTSSLDITELAGAISDNLGISEAQSEGGLASIFSYVKSNLTNTDYSELAEDIPGLESLLESAPETTLSTDTSSISGLLSKASEYSDTLSTINTLKQQFDALGLDSEMISEFISQINAYLSDEQASDTQALLQSGLGNLLSML